MMCFTVQYSHQDLGSESVDTCNQIENSSEFNVVRQEYRDLHDLTLSPGLAMNGLEHVVLARQTSIAVPEPQEAGRCT